MNQLLEQPTPELRVCAGCGFVQFVPPLAVGMSAHCARCSTILRRVSAHQPAHIAALVTAALVLLVLMCSSNLMTVQTAGIRHTANLFSGPDELARRHMAGLAAAVLFVTVIAPLARLIALLYVLARSHERSPPRHLRRIYAWAEWLRPWSMIDVFVLGVFVAYVKLGDVVTIGLSVGVYALLVLTFILVWIDSAFDRHALWERIASDHATIEPTSSKLDDVMGCHVCGLTSARNTQEHHCLRCDSPLHPRKPDSIARTWALVIAAAILYIPANYFPVLTIVQLGAGQPSTILGGIKELLVAGQYPLAALVLFASVLVPLLKLVGLAFMLIATQIGSARWLRDRTRLYHVVAFIGRWSMIDIFMESLLGALVVFGSVITIEPGVGAIAFCGVVFLTMFAAETFDPRLMWDAAENPVSPGIGVDGVLDSRARSVSISGALPGYYRLDS
jgi:paraquat-inducible protein A